MNIKGSGSSKLTYVAFGYSSSKLTTVTDKDGKNSTFEYTTNNLLSSATDIDGYKLSYTYTQTTAGKPSRVKTVKETSGSATGGELTIEYAHNQTTFTDHNGNVQIVQFNNWGNTVSIQDGEGRAQFAQYANNTASDTDTGKGNQLKLASKLQNTVGNMLDNSSFESATTWIGTATAVTCTPSSEAAYLGSKSLKLTRSSVGTAAGAYTVFSAEANQTYTFSAYVKTGAGSAYLAMVDGTTSVSSQVLPANSDWTRLEVSYTASTAKNVGVRLMTADAGTVYMDCVQVEKAPTASRYNMVQNGDFRLGTFWSSNTGNVEIEADQKAPAVQLDKKVYTMTGSPTAAKRISQTIPVSGSKDDTFVLAGWAKGDSAPVPVAGSGENQRRFAIIGTFNYTDGTKGEFIAQFNPDTDSTVNWQYSAAAMVAEKAYSSIKLELAYDYNVNTVYFDGIQLYKEEFGNSYLYDNEGNVTSVVDLQKKQTTYEYDTNNNLTGVFQDNKPKMTYEYFTGTHNVKKATTGEGLVYEFEYDDYGNNESVSITSGNLKLESTAEYENSGNTLKKTTDAAGKVTTYHYNANTNVLEWVKYPEDTDATRTQYTYDDMYRLATAAATTDQGSALTASYTYENDLLKKIETASTTYNFSYGNFALRSSIKVGSQELANYTYTSRNNYLDTLEYGNDDSVKYTYDSQGRVTKQTYEDGDTVTYAYDNNGALATVTDSATGRTTTYYYDFTDRLMKYVEKGSNYTHSVGYEYDDINNLTALVDTINGVKYTTSYTYDDDNRVTSVTAGLASRTYGYDGFSRVNSRVTKHNSSPLLTDTLTYRTPTATTTSGQIATLRSQASGYDVTSNYTYDDNGNILSVSDGTHTSSYVYDTANQLIRENNQKLGKTWVWEYDSAGNIKSRREYAYTTGTLGEVLDTVTYDYDNSNWKDLLTNYNGTSITHDNIGNPLDDGTWTYTWEHGRELMSMYGEDIGGEANDVTITYEYDADGMRTKKIVTTNHYHVHDYTAVVTPPTCTEGGYTTHTCDCGDSYTDTETEATGHTLVPSQTDPTCTETGEYRETCACGYETVEILPALGHTYEDQTTDDPETGASVTQTVCTRCDYVWADHVHDYSQTVVAPTCTEGGWTIFTCAACGVSYEDDYTSALGHGYLEEVVHGLAIQSASSKLQCVRCDESIQLERHFFIITNNVGAPTCTEHGYSLCECDCGYSYHMEAGSATGHNYTSTVVAPTEDSYGYTLYTCSACGDSYKDNFVNHEHSYTESTVVAATCTEGGYTLHECECGHSYRDNETSLLGHNIYQDKNPSTGMLDYFCSRCRYSYTLKHTQTYSLRGRSQRILESTTVEEYSYVYTGGSLMQMEYKITTTPADGTPTTQTSVLNFTYDASGMPMSVKYGSTYYYYVTNIQGDVVALLNTSGTAVVEYTYDAWGNIHSITGNHAPGIGKINPLTYRGYVYDSDSGYYYLQSRYYAPDVGRFINADVYATTGIGLLGNNMFAYCNNNPVNMADALGVAPWPTTKNISDCRVFAPIYEGEGNYFDNKKEDLFSSKMQIDYYISKSEANEYYHVISQGDYGSMIEPPFLSWISGMHDYLSTLSDLVDIGKQLSAFGYRDVYDPENRLLYLEEGYTVVTIYRVYIGNRYSATETEYLIFDENANLVFNDTIMESRFSD